MGFDLKRVVNEVHEELVCRLCAALVLSPQLLLPCHHLFCRQCLQTPLVCPVDGNPALQTHVKAVPSLVLRLIAKLDVFCQFRRNGCLCVLKMAQLEDHETRCPFKDLDKRLLEVSTRLEALEDENRQLRRELTALRSALGAESHSMGRLVVRTDDKTLIVDADTHETIRVIKQRIQRMEQSDEETVAFLANRELDDNKTLDDYRVHRLHSPLLLFVVKK